MNMLSLDKRWIAAAAAILLAGVTVLLVWKLGDDSDEPPAQGKLTGEAPPLDPWAADDAPLRSVRLDPNRGPILELASDTEIAITPTTDGLSLDWELQRSGPTVQFVGTGQLEQSTVRAVWTMVEGNPQAHLQLSVRDVPASWLADDLVLTTHLPPGELQSQAPGTDEAGAIATAALWQDGDHEVGFSNWTGEELAAGGQNGQSSLLSFILWSKTDNRGWAVCENASDDLTVDVSAAATMTIGAPPPVARWPFAKGREAHLIALFDDPTHHPDDEMAHAAANSAEQWLLRARTLAYGHSEPSEPRYGNGGLLGHGLGGTIVVPTEFLGDDDVQQFADSLTGTGVELAPRAAAGEGFDRRSRLLEGADCAALLEASEREAPAVVTRLRPASQLEPLDTLGPGPGALAAALPASQLDGRLDSLLSKGLDPDELDSLVDKRAHLLFSTPFVATRNPLVGAATEALLEPERGGQWTVSSRFAAALADLELWREAAPLQMTSLGDAISYTAKTRGVGLEWEESGALIVHNPSDRPVAGFTLAVAGRAKASLAETRVESRFITGGDVPMTTLLWWNLEPGATRLDLDIAETELERPAPVRWSAEQP